jgi:hypothetical protein
VSDYDERFVNRLKRQIADNHAEVSTRNQYLRSVWAQAPSLSVASRLFFGRGGGLQPETPAEFREANQLFLDQMLDQPLVKRYIQHVKTVGKQFYNTDWWHAVAAQQMAAVSVASARTLDAARSLAQEHHVGWESTFTLLDPRLLEAIGPDASPEELAFEWAGRVLGAQTFLWTRECFDAATAAPLVPHVFQPNALPYDNLFFCFEGPTWRQQGYFPVRADDDQERQVRADTWVRWVNISRVGDAGCLFVLGVYVDPEDWSQYASQIQLRFEPVSWGARWPDDFDPESAIGKIIPDLLRCLSFMQAPFVDAAPIRRRFPRDIRREYTRQGRPEPSDEDVSIIVLRRALHEPVFPNGDSPDGTGREYKHSWWVTGHYRWQWYPSEGAHRLIPIAQYVKQAGKPMLKKIHVVKQ